MVRRHPLTPPGALPQTFNEPNSSIFGVASIMSTHDRLDRLCSLVGVVEGNGANVVVEDVGFNNAVEKVWTNRPEIAVNCCSSAAGKGPGGGVVVR